MNTRALAGRLARLRARVAPTRAPKTWVLVLEEGAVIPDDIRAALLPGDTVVIREVPVGFLPLLTEAKDEHKSAYQEN